MKKLFIFLVLLVALASCQKTIDVTPSEKPKPTKELIVNPSFDWKTSKEITLNLVGLKGVTVSNTLYIKSSVGDTTYYQDFLNMGLNYTIYFAVPSTETKIILVYGSKIQTIDLLSNTITFNYITE